MGREFACMPPDKYQPLANGCVSGLTERVLTGGGGAGRINGNCTCSAARTRTSSRGPGPSEGGTFGASLPAGGGENHLRAGR